MAPLCVTLALAVQVSCAQAQRAIPRPLPEHPGNIYWNGEEVCVQVEPAIPEMANRWQVLDDAGNCVASGPFDRAAWQKMASVRLGQLGVGWYRIEFLDAANHCVRWTSAAVLAPLVAPTPGNSPICVDSATAWFARDDTRVQSQFANLAALAGIHWIRDRMEWSEIEPKPGEYAANTTYDTSAQLQSQQGLNILQVFHSIPEWAMDRSLDGDRGRVRFPRDLRHAWRFCRAMAERYRGRIQAWEPWNEANVQNFGSHTVDEMCSYQKAAYLGFKAGDPDLIVGWNAYAATPTRRHTEGILANETWPYFDTYNIHTYDWPDSYERLWEPAREAACGRPIWVTESDRGIQYETGPPWYELAPRNERLKAQFMAQSYATSLFAGASRHFHFILGHYVETPNKVQFGLLRRDLTPRPSYVALAAIGRLLAGARCLGRWENPEHPNTHVIAFRAVPDGVPHDVLVAWAEQPGDWPQRGNTRADWTFPPDITVHAVFDYFGRPLDSSPPSQLTSAPIFVLLPHNDAEKLPLTGPAKNADDRQGAPSPIVLQIQMPFSTTHKADGPRWSHDYVHSITPGIETELTLFAYNFSNERADGTIRLEEMPPGWRLAPDHWNIQIEPMGRTPLVIRIMAPALAGESSHAWFRWRGDFASSGRPVLACQLVIVDQ
ncbi:MAG: hypothetical protein JW829_20995 [Pirellulales bacterium]|nr:hypothetical protein [Pirellulales bacterium]